MSNDKKCSTCKWWGPKYAGVGICRREGSMHAKFWVSDADKGYLLTVASFSCSEHEDVPDNTEKETL